MNPTTNLHQQLIERETKLINYIDSRYTNNFAKREQLRHEVAIRSLMLVGLMESPVACINNPHNRIR